MPQRPNPKIVEFRKRVEWVTLNLPPNPKFRRFVADVNDVYSALEDAIREKAFAVGSYEIVPDRQTWQRAFRIDSVPKIYLEWLYTLYPDLSSSQLEYETFDGFLERGNKISGDTKRWGNAIRSYANKRAHMAIKAKRFYSEIDYSKNYDMEELEFPLLTKVGWIRTTPLPLKENTEDRYLESPSPIQDYGPRLLSGLSGDYVAYKGALAYANRRVVKPEPQHNGEIFRANSVLLDEQGFVGFKYGLARYFDYINTCEILGAELADFELRHPNEDLPPTLPFRGPPEDAFDFSNRAAYPGINCLAIFLNYSEPRLRRGNYFLLHKRDETQLQAQNSVHVVPAGGHQGFAKGGWLEDTSIWRTMTREFAEELFGMEVLETQPENWEDFLEYQDVRRIIHAFFRTSSPAANAYLHGFGLDPITLKPEVLVTIIIDWDKVPQGPGGFKLKYNWELQQKSKKTGTRHQWARLSKSELLRQAKGGVQSIGHTSLSTLPAGAACMIQTARHYELLGLR